MGTIITSITDFGSSESTAIFDQDGKPMKSMNMEKMTASKFAKLVRET